MKKIIIAFFSIALLFTSCQEKPKTIAVDTASAKAELLKTLDTMYLAYADKNATVLTSFLSDNGTFVGTDPDEFWDKTAYIKLLNQMFSNPAYSGKITIDKRELRLAEDANSAFVIDQFFSFWIKNIAVRHIYHFTKSGNKWLCDFSSMALIPKNDQLTKLSDALN